MSIQRPGSRDVHSSGSPITPPPTQKKFSWIRGAVQGALGGLEKQANDIKNLKSQLSHANDMIKRLGDINNELQIDPRIVEKNKRISELTGKIQEMRLSIPEHIQEAGTRERIRGWTEGAVGVVVAFVIYQLASYYLFPSETK